MTYFLTGVGIGFVAGAIAAMILAEMWIQKYTTREDQKKAVFGNARYDEGWAQGREALALEVAEILKEVSQCQK